MDENLIIDDNYFSEDDSILSIKFGKKCVGVGNNTFFKCTSLEGINDDNMIGNIGESAFEGCSDISTVTFDNLTKINNNVFSNCTSLSSINIPNCSEVGQGAFKNCSSLKNVDISNCNKIGQEAFLDCSSLVNVNIPNCSEVGQGAFKNCSSLVKVRNNKTETLILNSTFENCGNLKDISFNNFSEIGEKSFWACKSLEDINLNNCSKIGNSAFCGCEKLKKISLSICESIGEGAFQNCPELTEVYINNSNDYFCNLENKYVFCNEEGGTPYNNIKFYLRPDTILSYQTGENWSYYKDRMVSMAGSNQIKYTSTSGKIIEVTDSIKNLLKEGGNVYEDGFGLLTFKNDIVDLNEKIFKEEYRSQIESIEISYKCKRIGANIFEDYTELKSIKLPISLEKIGDYAFKNCQSLEEIEMPESVINLGGGIFAGCIRLNKITGKFSTYSGKALIDDKNKLICVVPTIKDRIINISDINSNISELGEFCFNGCESLRRVDMPQNITVIGNNAFDNCKNLIEVHFHGSIPPEIGGDVFNGVREDFKIFVPEETLSLYIDNFQQYSTNIYPRPNDNSIIYYSKSKLDIVGGDKSKNGEYYIVKSNNINNTLNNFRNTNVEKVIICDNVNIINTEAFYNCNKLEYIYLPDQIREFKDRCFCGCESLTNIHIPSSTTSFGKEIFSGCKSLKEFITYKEGYTSDDNRCYIMNNKLMFFAHGDLIEKSYEIPKNIKFIGEYAFVDSDITEITLHDNISAIGEYAFRDCTILENIENWDGVKTISNYAFYNCTSLDGILLPNELTTIGNYAFYNCTSLGEISFPDSVTSIGKSAFEGCSKFSKLSLNSNNITVINESTFKNCGELTEVSIGSSITSINKNAFDNCKKLTTVNIAVDSNSNLETIGNYAFSSCESLKTLNIPNTIKNIGDYAFKDCVEYNGGSDNTFVLPDSVTSIGVGCFQNSGIIKLELGEGSKLEKIQNYAFYGCEKLEYIDISKPTKLNSIGISAFNGCKKLLNLLYLPNNLEHIYDYAFNGCSNIGDVLLPVGLKYLGDFCLATGSSSTQIRILDELITPPKFTKNGLENINSNPFGLISKPDLLPLICMSKRIYSIYNSNEYWRKYNKRFDIY